jgi:uncharacterized repeat protein (TIGR03803 family)
VSHISRVLCAIYGEAIPPAAAKVYPSSGDEQLICAAWVPGVYSVHHARTNQPTDRDGALPAAGKVKVKTGAVRSILASHISRKERAIYGARKLLLGLEVKIKNQYVGHPPWSESKVITRFWIGALVFAPTTLELRWTMKKALPIAVLSVLAFSLQAVAQTVTESVLYNFCSQSGCTDGSSPISGLIQALDGNFYGTTLSGAEGPGTMFRLTPSGQLTTLHEFSGGADGGFLFATVTQGSDGNLYGVTTNGGNLANCPSQGCGTVFKITPSGNLTTLYTFCSAGSLNSCPDGNRPEGELIEGADGNLYGTTTQGGNQDDCLYSSQPLGCGTIFKVTLDGNLTTLYTFTGASDGGGPQSMLQGSDGNFYGIAYASGVAGIIYRLTPSGAYSLVFTFPDSGIDGEGPYPGLFEYKDGSFYGATYEEGDSSYCASSTPPGCGTLFKVTSSGAFTLLYSFTDASDGAYPYSGLFLGSDGNFYGAAQRGGNTSVCTTNGPPGCGDVFQLSPDRDITDLYSFQGTPDGQEPTAGIIQGSDGSFYGTTYYGGTSADDAGTVFKVSLTPSLPAPVQLSLSASSITIGQSVTLKWSVLNAFSTTMQQCYGFVTNSAGATTALGRTTGTLTDGVYSGSVSLTPTTAGAYAYALTCGGIESGFANLTVTGYPTTTVLADSGTPVLGGATETLTITVAPVTKSSIVPTGTVSLLYKGSVVNTASLSRSVGTIKVTTTNFAAESYTVTASYSGDSNYAASTSNAVTVVVQPDATTTTLTASPDPVTEGDACLLTAKVTTSAGTPQGYVDFFYGSDVLGSADLVDGAAKLSESSAGVAHGTYGITARYSGDGAHSASTSNTVNVQVE